MKKLLSICFLSIVLVLAGFTSKAQTTNCCFWLENMQPETLQDISNLGIEPGTAALLPGQGRELVLNNTLNYVGDPALYTGGSNPIQYVPGSQTDWFTVNFGNCTDPNTLVSLEWILYENGNPISTENLHQYADIYIYTRYDQLANTDNVNPTCGNMGWLGGHVTKPGVCTQVHNNCDGGYPGALADVDNSYPYGFNSFISSGYTRLSYYNFDAFRYSFLKNSVTRIAIKWNQIGNYSLVVRLRERTNGGAGVGQPGTDNFENLGANGTCCGEVLASDSLHYLVTSASEKSLCDGETYTYGKPAAVYSKQGQYKVLFGEYVCDHWEIDRIEDLSLFVRVNPVIVASDLTVCKKELVTNDDFAALAPAVSTDVPGYLNHRIEWSTDGTTWKKAIPAHPTDVPGTYTYYVRQANEYRDSTEHENFWCQGPADEFTMTVLDVNPPVLVGDEELNFCFSELPQDVKLKAKLNNEQGNTCADNIHWFVGTECVGTPVYQGELSDNISTFIDTIAQETNKDGKYIYTAYSYDASTQTYSTTGVSVTINVWKNPELIAKNNPKGDSIVTCPGSEGIVLNSNFTSTNFESGLTWNYSWIKNNRPMIKTDATIKVNAPECGEKDVYVVTATVESTHGCEATISRRFTVEGIDNDTLTIAWRNNSTATQTLYGCDTANLFEGSVWNTPFTIANIEGESSIIKVKEDHCSNASNLLYTVQVDNTLAPCSNVVTRSYQLVDACGNKSNVISQEVTIINNQKPTIVGQVVTLDPVRPENNDCKSNLPARAALLAAFHANFDTTTTCGAAISDDNISFFLGNTNTAADGNEDIFANASEVTVYAQVKDECGNISSKDLVFRLVEPAHLYVAHGAITASKYDFCNTDTGHVVFDPYLIQNGKAPYTYTWSQTPIPAQCGMAVADNSIEADVWALQREDFNSVAQFIITIQDAYGCVTTDTSNAFRWYGLPDVTIIENPQNDNNPHAGDIPSVCPTYGNYHVIAAANSNLPAYKDQTLTYKWSGESTSCISSTEANSENAFIAVNEQECERLYTISVEVENAMGCKATDSYSIQAEDVEAPVVTLNKETDTITDLVNCKIQLPDYTGLYTNANVSDNCLAFNNINFEISQQPAAGTVIEENTDVIVTIAPKCGPAAYDTIKVCFPADRIETEILASKDSSCFPYTTTFTTNTINFVAPLTITWDGSEVAESLNFTTVSETGNTLTHSVRVEDANGCVATADYTLFVYHTPIASDVVIETTKNHYCDEEHFDGTFTVSAANGSEVDFVRLHGTNEWKALPYTETVKHGKYVFDLHTINGCEADSIAFAEVLRDTTDANLNISLQVITDNANCSRPWSGTIQVMNPVANYTYYISAGDSASGDETIVYNPATSASVQFVHLYQDNYTVYVTSTRYCHANASATIDDDRLIPTEVAVQDIVVTANTNCTSPRNGAITLNNTNGSFYYSLDGQSEFLGGRSVTFNNLAKGEHNLVIASYLNPEHTQFNCFVNQTIFVPDSSNAPAADSLIITPDQYCINGNGTISVYEPVSGVQYTLGGQTLVAPNVKFTNLEADSYTITLLDVATGCNDSVHVVVPESLLIPAFNGEITLTDNENCTGTPNGSIAINEDANYVYTVYNEGGIAVSDLTTLAAGSYRIVKHSSITGCEKDTIVNVINNYPEVTLKLSATKDLDCSTIGTGKIKVECSEIANYTVVKDQNDTTTLSDLNPGFYTVFAVVPSTGCTYKDTITVHSDYTYPQLSAVTTANYSCNENAYNGTLTITDTQKVKNYTSITVKVNDEESQLSRTDLNEGDYTITAVSNYNCPAELIVVSIADSAFIIRNFEIVPNSACNPTFNRPGNGKIIVLNPQSDDCRYLFSYLGDGRFDVNHFDPINFTKYTLIDGQYAVTIYDDRNGCVSYDTLTVPFVMDTVKIDQITSTPDYYCTQGVGNGTISVQAHSVNASSDLYYSIDNGQTYQVSGEFANLDNGNYVVVVKDSATHCVYDQLANNAIEVISDKYVVDFTFDNVANTACDSTRYNGQVVVSAAYRDNSLAAGNFSFDIEGGSFVKLNGGTYNVTATDLTTGCTYDSIAVVPNNAQYAPHITVQAFNYSDSIAVDNYHYCKNQDNGYMIASASSDLEGDNSFHYQWNNDCHNINPIDEWTNISTTDDYLVCDYKVTVTSDSTGCSSFAIIKITIDTLPVIEFYADGQSIRRISGTSTDNILYANCQNKEFTLGVRDNGLKEVSWTNSYESSDASFVIPANYLEVGNSSFCVVITDNNNCTSGPTSVTVKTLPIPTATDTVVACDTFTYHNNGVVADTTFKFDASGTNVHTIIDTLRAVSTCDSIVTYTIILNSTPELKVNIASELFAAYCDSSYIISGTDTSLSVLYTQDYGWRIIGANDVPSKLTYNTAGEEFDPTSALSDTMNGNKVYAYAANSCDTMLSSVYTLTVYNAPTLATTSLEDDTICLGQAANFVAPTGIEWHGSIGTSHLQYSRNGGRTWSQYIAPVYPALADTFAVRFVASNMCDSDVVLDGPVYVTVNDTVKLSISDSVVAQTICLGSAITPIVITNSNSTVSIDTLPNGLSYDTLANTIKGTPTSAGPINLSITATSTCGCTSKTVNAQIFVNDTVNLVLNNANQTICLGDTIKHIVIQYSNANVASLVSKLPAGLAVSSDTVGSDYYYTIKGAPTAAGTTIIPVNAISSFGCSNSNDTIRLIVNDTVKLEAKPLNKLTQSICLGGSIDTIYYSATNAIVSVVNFGSLDTNTANSKLFGAPTSHDTIYYSIQATSTNGCTATDKKIDGTIIVRDTVSLEVNPSNMLTQEICLGNGIDTLTVTSSYANVTVENRGSLSYQNSKIFGAPTSHDTIRFTVKAASTTGCTSSDKSVNGVIIVNDTTTLSATPLAQTPICLGSAIIPINIYPSNKDSVSVEGLVHGLTFNGTNKISGTPDTAGVHPYTITVTSAHGCAPKTINDTIVVNDTVKFAPVADTLLTQTVCKDANIADIAFNFANASLSIVGQLPDGITFVDSVISGAPTIKNLDGYVFTVRATSTAIPTCGNKDIQVTIKVNDVPELTPITGGDLKVCLGDAFGTPVAPTVTENGYTTTTMWEYDGSEYSWSTPSTADMNGDEFYYVATNTCGTTRDTATFTVDTLPVPAIVSDTIVCEGGSANLAVQGTYVTYQWYKGNAKIDGATAATYSYEANDGEGTYQFTVVVKDANGCISKTNSNATLDVRPFSNDTAVTVIVTGKPRFIFTHNGAETHTFAATTEDPSTQYQWMISNPCGYNEDTLVFVNFDIYYNGELIDDDSIGMYISEAGILTDRYVTRDSINWSSTDGVSMNATCFYNYAQSNMATGYYQSNHYPAGNLGFSGNTKYDDMYLHFLSNRTVYKTINQFRRPGQYTIVYKLYATSNSHANGHNYKAEGNVSKRIGGYDAVVSSANFDLLAQDVLTINVDGAESQSMLAAAPDMSPEIDNAPVAKSASMKVFPNPATKTAAIKATCDGISGNATVKIQSLAGNVISQQNTYITPGTPVQIDNVAKLTSGVYIITIETKEATISRKLVISE